MPNYDIPYYIDLENKYYQLADRLNLVERHMQKEIGELGDELRYVYGIICLWLAEPDMPNTTDLINLASHIEKVLPC